MQLDFPRINEAIHYTLTFYGIDRIKEYMEQLAETGTIKVTDPDTQPSKRGWHEIVITIQKRMDNEIMQHMLISNPTALAYMFDTLERWTQDYRFESVWVPDILYEIDEYNNRVYEEFLIKQEDAEEKFKATEEYKKYSHLEKFTKVHKIPKGFMGVTGIRYDYDLEYNTEEVFNKFLTAYCPTLIDTAFLGQYVEVVKGLIDNFKLIVNKHLAQYNAIKHTYAATPIRVQLPDPDQPKIVQPQESKKIKTKLTAGQILYLFQTLIEIDAIESGISKIDICRFIAANLSSNDTENLSPENLAKKWSGIDINDIAFWADKYPDMAKKVIKDNPNKIPYKKKKTK